ncbi:hypothetical protein BJV82DRAFT_673503 [Fennellomyces sp. T-0311]|nr:hypothetical protein BJV82DRAFT_673503 [Fennellomyces sp. T-0311]
MDIACFIPLHFHHQDSGSLALSGTHWHRTDTCLFVDSLTPACNSNKKRRVYQASPLEPSRKKRYCQQDMLPRRRSSIRPNNTRRSSQQQPEQQQQQQQQQHQQQQQQMDQQQLVPVVTQDVATVNSMEEDLHHLRDEWATIDIVLHSLRNAFTVHPLESATEEHLDDVDRELSIAYDDLKAQVRHLERSLHRLDAEINIFRTPQTPVTTTASSSIVVPGSPSTPKSKVSTSLPKPTP